MEASTDYAGRFVPLLAEVQPRLYRYILGLVGNFTDGDEVMLRARRRMGQRFGEYDPQTDFLLWGMQIAYGCIEEYRREKGEEAVFSEAAMEALKREAVNAAIWEKISFADLKSCILKLPEKDRHLIRARYIDGKRPEEINVGSIRTEQGVMAALSRICDVLLDCVKGAMK